VATAIVLVARDRPELHAYFARQLACDGAAEVVADRRQADRRSRPAVERVPERRGEDRRRGPDVSPELAQRGFAVIRRQTGAPRVEPSAPAAFAWPHPTTRQSARWGGLRALSSRGDRAEAARWLEEGRRTLPLLREHLAEAAVQAESEEREAERRARQIQILWAENQVLRRERAEVADRLTRLVNFPLLNQVLQRLRNAPGDGDASAAVRAASGDHGETRPPPAGSGASLGNPVPPGS
jgi:hypothetical protein